MKVLYIGQYTAGTTSKMRADALKQHLKPRVFQIIDTHIPFYKTHKLWRSIAFRTNLGPTIHYINTYILKQLNHNYYDLIWVDKATFITKLCTNELRRRCDKMIHYTPDMMFYENNSRKFKTSLSYYDTIVTTKSTELPIYQKYVKKSHIKWVTQGFDANIHTTTIPFESKTDAVVFIGLAEPSREQIIQYLIDEGIVVHLAGIGWRTFIKRNAKHKNLKYIGPSLIGEAYSQAISEAKFGLGLLSKRFPELHTTRTFEIPACGTALLTERNIETQSFFKEDEVVFFKDKIDLAERIQFYLKNDSELKALTQKGHQNILAGGYDNKSIIKAILAHSDIR